MIDVVEAASAAAAVIVILFIVLPMFVPIHNIVVCPPCKCK